ncbi:lipoprotein [Teredinibacter turnerae]|uniref:lipoprotein n=1 Tax=Teredinibacter turnerae TaxID=2426 RepID=UPI0003F5D28C|nr:lipoprotein [Teredinibacter turnerae]
MNKIALVFLLLFLGACAISSKVTHFDGEGRIPDSFLDDIRRNKTEKYWITANLGDPDFIQEGPLAQEIYTYRFSRAKSRHGNLLFFFRYDGANRETEYFHVVFQEDVVKRYWLDDYAQVQAERYFKKTKNPKKPITEPTPLPWEPKVDAMPGTPKPPAAPSSEPLSEPAPSNPPTPADYYQPKADDFRI